MYNSTLKHLAKCSGCVYIKGHEKWWSLIKKITKLIIIVTFSLLSTACLCDGEAPSEILLTAGMSWWADSVNPGNSRVQPWEDK